MADEDNNQENIPAAHEAESKTAGQSDLSSRLRKFKEWYRENKKISLPVTILLLIIILASVPFTRYALAGTVLKKDYQVQVLDSVSRTPVSGAQVSIGQISAGTDASGKAILRRVKVGKHQVVVSKKYYKGSAEIETVPIFKQKQPASLSMVATGRQVNVTITNAIDKSVLSGVEISAAGTTAKTDSSGTALLVLPAGMAEQKAKLSLNGYNDASVIIKVSDNKVQNNGFSLTPAGKVYFLSKLSGRIDVVKTNLDGSDRQTVLAGTGSEDDQNTVLLASRDWKYLTLLSRRAGSSASLYLIDTTTDSSTVIDSGSADYSLVGWAGDRFVYTATRNDIQLWQPGRQIIKSYDPAAKKITVLDQTTASGTSNFDFVSQLIGSVYAYDDLVYYVMNWTSSDSGTNDVASKQATFNSVKPDGTAKKAIRSFGLQPDTQAVDIVVDARVKSPGNIELFFSDGVKDNFYVYADGQTKTDASTTAGDFYGASYPTYLLSPSGDNTFWSEPRDGKNTLFVGPENGSGGKQIATLSDYSPYGWFTDNYLLVTKNSSELYIMDKAGKQTPIKISDYHKPSQSFPGYGDGYGGL